MKKDKCYYKLPQWRKIFRSMFKEYFLNQKYKNIEIIFFDNLSSDNSKNIIRNFSDERIKFFSSKKNYIYHARNQAIDYASGELIAFLDVDDWWDVNYLSSRETVFDNNNYDIFYNNAFFHEKNNKFKKYKNYTLPNGKIYDYLAKDYFIIISGSIIRKKVFDKVGKFIQNLILLEITIS